MIRNLRRLAASLCLFFSACGLVWAQTPALPEVAARAYLLIDVTAQQVLAEREADKPVEPASSMAR